MPRTRSWMIRVRYRVRSRNLAISAGGMNEPRNSPHSSSWASHSESATSVLRPGRFRECAGFTNNNSNPASSSTCQTGFQYTPVASIAHLGHDHRRLVLGLWVAVFFIGGALQAAGNSFREEINLPDSESKIGFDILDEHFGGEGTGINGRIVFQARRA